MTETDENSGAAPEVTAVEDEDFTPAILASWGLSGEPVTWASVEMQPVISVIRATNTGFGSAEFVQMALDAAYPDKDYVAADVCLPHPPTGVISMSTTGDANVVDFTVDDDLTLLGSDNVTWDFGDDSGPSTGRAVSHTFPSSDEEVIYTVAVEEMVAGVRTVGTLDVTVGVVQPGTTDGDDDEYFDPSEHTVAEVHEYLEEHPDEEKAIFKAERKGKARAGILGS